MLKKSEIIANIANETNLTKADVERVLEAHNKLLMEEVKSGEDFILNGVGKVKLSHRNERKGRNPRTGEEITIAASNSATLSISKSFKDLLNG